MNPSANHLPPEYDDIHPAHYDPSFTHDISSMMRVPHKLGRGDDDEENPFTRYDAPQPMTVPDRILVAGQDQHIGMRENLELNLDMHGVHEPPTPLELSTPPRTLTLDENMFPSLDETPYKEAPSANVTTLPNGYQTPRRQSGPHYTRSQPDLIATPGDGLLLNDGDLDDVAILRRQVAKLTRHVLHIEDDNRRRSQREVIFYPVVLGYLIFQVAKFLLGRQ